MDFMIINLIFQTDADKVVTYVARRLGYPIMDVELQDLNFYAAFEDAVTTYGNELYAYKVRKLFIYRRITNSIKFKS